MRCRYDRFFGRMHRGKSEGFSYFRMGSIRKPSTLPIFKSLQRKENCFPFPLLRSALEEFELRTILLLGEFGNFPENKPVEVRIINDLRSRDGQSFQGQKISVPSLAEGPVLSYAEHFELGPDYPYNETERGTDCPDPKPFRSFESFGSEGSG